MDEKEMRRYELVGKYNDKTISDDEFRELIISCFSGTEDDKKVVSNPAFVKRLKAVINRFAPTDYNIGLGKDGYGNPVLYMNNSDKKRLFTLTSSGIGIGYLHFHSPFSEVRFVSRKDGAFSVEIFSEANGVVDYLNKTDTDESGIDVLLQLKRKTSDDLRSVDSTRDYEMVSIIRKADPTKVDLRHLEYKDGQRIMLRGVTVNFDSRDPFDVLSARYADTRNNWPDISEETDYSFESSPEQLEMMFASCTNDVARTELESRIDTVNAKK